MMKTQNTIFPWRISDGAYSFMSQVLNYPEQVDSRMDGKICRITITSYTIKDNIRSAYREELAKDHLWQIAILGIEDKEFLILHSLLIPLDEELIVVTPEGSIKTFN